MPKVSSVSKIFSRMMGASEKLCLQWNDFKENITSSFRELREDRDFTDVTLACEDGSQIEAHRVVLASSSPFFMELLKKNRHQHPLLYMRGLRSENLLAMVDFLYHGEANVCQENLDSFLALAEELELKGLSGNSEREPEMATVQTKGANLRQENSPKSEAAHSESNEEAPPPKSPNNTTVALTSDKISVDLDLDLDDQIKSMMTKSDIRSSNGQGNLATCNICGKQGPSNAMPRHIEANHIIGVSHACDLCGKVSRSRNALRMHISNFHQPKVISGQEEH